MIRPLLLALLAASAAAAAAQPAGGLVAAQRAGIVGERFDGYLGFARTPSAEIRRQVGAINIKRRSLYVALAQKRNVTVEVAGMVTACELIDRIGVGQAYMLADGKWRLRSAGEEPSKPDYCP